MADDVPARIADDGSLAEDPGFHAIGSDEPELHAERFPLAGAFGPEGGDVFPVHIGDGAGPSSAGGFLGGHACDFAPTGIHEKAGALGVGPEDTDRAGGDQGLEVLPAFAGGEFGNLAVRDVLGHSGDP